MLVPRLRTLVPSVLQFQEPEAMFDQLLRDFDQAAPRRPAFPRWNVAETETNYLVEIEVPGFTEKDLDIQVHANQLTVSGTRETQSTSKQEQLVHSERFSGKFSRSLRFTTPLDTDRITANAANGILTITLPKSAAALPRRIEVRHSTSEAI